MMMIGTLNLPRAIAGAALLTGIGLASEPAYGQPVGAIRVVVNEVIGTPAGEAARSLRVGDDITFNERITTGSNSAVMIYFVDGSAMAIPPNSDMVIDEFVADPAGATGKLAANLTGGAFRFVGGKLSKRQEGSAGVVQNVIREVESTLPGAPTQSLVSGQEIFFEQRITTDTTGQAQIRFTDGSTKALGPNSDTIIGDKSVIFKTPSATIGTRG
jgi:hypothetical protein